MLKTIYIFWASGASAVLDEAAYQSTARFLSTEAALISQTKGFRLCDVQLRQDSFRTNYVSQIRLRNYSIYRLKSCRNFVRPLLGRMPPQPPSALQLAERVTNSVQYLLNPSNTVYHVAPPISLEVPCVKKGSTTIISFYVGNIWRCP